MPGLPTEMFFIIYLKKTKQSFFLRFKKKKIIEDNINHS